MKKRLPSSFYQSQRKFWGLLLVLIVLGIGSIILNLNTGFLPISLADFWNDNPIHQEVIQLRLNRVLVMLIAGLAGPTSGFLLQEYFRNPLAGPSVLGISSAASLFVAIYLLIAKNLLFSEMLHQTFLSSFAILGSGLLLILLLIVSRFFKDTSHIIIFGFLISALSGAVISLLQFYAEDQNLKSYILWSFGGNHQVNATQLGILVVLVFIGLIISFKCIKPLIGLSLGTSYAQTMGVSLSLLKICVILASSLLTASITAFLGPILFIGVIVPHFCRMLWNPAQLWHQWLLNLFLGIVIMETFSTLSEMWQIPLNTITSLFGVPVILLMMIKNRK